MALSRKKPVGYPEISFLSFDVLALLAKLQQEMGLDSVGPVSFSLQTMETLACIRWEQGKPGAISSSIRCSTALMCLSQ
jgi:hypothetical protein